MHKQKQNKNRYNAQGRLEIIKKDWHKNRVLYFLVLPVIAFYLIFSYKPMYGAIIAFKDYSPGLGIMGSRWIGFENYRYFFQSPDLGRILKNTLTINLTQLLICFPAPLLLALLFNEIGNEKFKKTAQTVSYLPHFISLVVICGLIKMFVASGGFVQQLVEKFDGVKIGLLSREEMFLPIYVISDLWQSVGWGSIMYVAALSGVDRELYEAAGLDGAGKWKQMLHVTLPGIKPTIIIMLILRIGSIMNVGYEKIILLYNPMIFNTSDVISSYVYRTGFESQDWSYSAAVGLFNSVINFIFLITANRISAKCNESSLW